MGGKIERRKCIQAKQNVKVSFHGLKYNKATFLFRMRG